MHLSKPNVYHTLVSVWRHSRPSEETSIDTLGQLVSPPFSGVIVIVRSQEGRLSGFKNREEWKNSPSAADADLMVIAERESSAQLARRLNTDVDRPRHALRRLIPKYGRAANASGPFVLPGAYHAVILQIGAKHGCQEAAQPASGASGLGRGL